MATGSYHCYPRWATMEWPTMQGLLLSLYVWVDQLCLPFLLSLSALSERWSEACSTYKGSGLGEDKGLGCLITGLKLQEVAYSLSPLRQQSKPLINAGMNPVWGQKMGVQNTQLAVKTKKQLQHFLCYEHSDVKVLQLYITKHAIRFHNC